MAGLPAVVAVSDAATAGGLGCWCCRCWCCRYCDDDNVYYDDEGGYCCGCDCRYYYFYKYCHELL